MMMGFATIYLLLVLVSIDVISCCRTGVYLTSSKTIVEENTTVTLICNYKPGQTKVEVIWNSSIYQSEARFARSGDKCICDGYFYDTNNYECKCDTDGQLSVVVKNVNRSYNGAKWSCRAQASSPCNEVILNVSVPIRKTEIHANDIGPVYENATTTFFCSTFSLPAADINWSITNGTVVKMLSNNNRVNITRRETNTSDKLIKVNETLTYRVDRYVHGWKISCNASTLKGSTVPAIALHLYVVYPPDNPPKIYSFINESMFSAIEGKTVNLSCSVEGGNPPGIPKWTCLNKNKTVIHKKEYDKIPDRIATSYLTFTAMRFQVDKCVCQTDHKLSHDFVYVAINILYPPNNPIIQLRYDKLQSNVTGIVKLLEKHFYTLLCWADANPSPKYTFKGIHGFANETLTLEGLQTNSTGNYSCAAENVMRPSFGTIVTGSNITTITLDVLYRPSIDVITNASVIEGDNFNKVCPLIEGNPPGASVEWIGMKHNFTYSRSHYLSIRKITRDHDMYFMCKAYTTLTPTLGRNKTVSASSQFHLNVIYEATINSFYTNPSHTVLNENQTYEFICEVDSNPGATINIEMQNGEKFMVRSSYRLKNNYTITSCWDIGRYTCTAINVNAKGHVNRIEKDLLVNCVPIPFSKPKIEVQSSLHSPAILSFITIAYPEPTCSWKIWNETSWSDIMENIQQHRLVATSNILSSNTLHIFQCNLTITHFTKWKREEFQLRVENVVGEYVQRFTLKPRVADDKPKSKTSSATIAGGLVGVLLVVSTVLVTFWIIRKRIRGTFAKEVYQNVHLHGNGNVYDRVTPLQDRTDIELKELTYESIAANGNYDNPVYINLQL